MAPPPAASPAHTSHFRILGVAASSEADRLRDALRHALPAPLLPSVAFAHGVAHAAVHNVPHDTRHETAHTVADVARTLGLSAAPLPPALDLRFRVDGMTCRSCVARVQDALDADLPDRVRAEVRLDDGQGTAVVREVAVEDRLEIASGVVRAVARVGKVATLLEPQTVALRFRVDGMTCQNCVRSVTECLRAGLPEHLQVHVALEEGSGSATLDNVPEDQQGNLEQDVIRLVSSAGKSATPLPAELDLPDSPPALKQANDPRSSLNGKLIDVPMNTPSVPVSHKSDELPSATSASNHHPSTTRIRVEGMTCSSCVGRVEAILCAIPGVVSAAVTLISAQALVHHNKVPVQTLISAVENAGYQSGEITCSEDSSALYLLYGTRSDAEDARCVLKDTQNVAKTTLLPCKRSEASWTGRRRGRRQSWWANGASDAPVVLRIELETDYAHAENPKLALVNNLRDRMDSSSNFVVVGSRHAAVTGVTDVGATLDHERRRWLSSLFLALIFFVPLYAITLIPRLHRLGLAPVGNTRLRSGELLSFALATPIQFISGAQFHRNAFYAIWRRGQANMDVLVSFGSSIAYATSLALLLSRLLSDSLAEGGDRFDTVFGTAAMLITFVLIGKWLEASAKSTAADGVAELSLLRPSTATLVARTNAGYKLLQDYVEVDLLRPGDLVRVAPGELIPADCEVIDGQTLVDESMLTGESMPIQKNPGDTVYSGTANTTSMFVGQVSATGPDTVLTKILDAIEKAQSCRAPIETYADWVSSIFVPLILSISVLVFLVWYVLARSHVIPGEWIGDESPFLFALFFALAAMVVACPCAFGLATPTVVMVACGLAAKEYGILYRGGGSTFEKCRNVRSVAFDKTGTLTMGHAKVQSWVNLRSEEPLALLDEDMKYLELIASAESCSEHPLARALVHFVTEDKGLSGNLPTRDVEEMAGRGMKCVVHGYNVCIGSVSWVLSENWAPPSARKLIRSVEESCQTVVVAAVNGQVCFAFAISDSVRPEAKDVVAWFHSLGYQCWVVSGDSRLATSTVASRVGINSDFVVSEAPPWRKAEVVESISRNGLGGGVVFVGDGINDAPALSAATVGVAMGSGTQVAVDSADVVVSHSDLRDAVIAVDLARRSFNRVQWNYAWALVYNSVSVPLAGGALYPLTRMRIPPYAAAGLMVLSSVSVVASSLMLRLYRSPFDQERRWEGGVAARPVAETLGDNVGDPERRDLLGADVEQGRGDGA